MKVLLTKPFFEKDISYIKNKIHRDIEIIIPNSFDENTIKDAAKDADVLFGPLMSESILSNAENLKYIQVPWTGVDKLDFELLSKFNVKVCNSHSNSSIVAEHAIALMFDSAKKISYHDALLRHGKWNRPKPDNSNEITPFSKEIKGSTIGIIGYGAIGQNIHHFLENFSCSFKIFNRTGRFADEKKNTSFIKIDEIYEHLNKIHFIFIAVALTDKTVDLIDNKFFDALNNDSILINISRGEVINEKDLYDALLKNKISFAGIDTWYNYPSKDNPESFPSSKYPFHELSNIVISPHRAGMIDGSLPHLNDAITNLNRIFEGKDLINVVSLTHKY
jgi:phosphoglycerate dehydrogenase-like enzyme